MIRSGWLRYSMLSFSFAYAVCVQMGLVVLHCWYHEHFSGHWAKVLHGITFQNVLFSFLMVSQVVHSLIAAYSWLREAPLIVSNYNATILLEAKARELLPLCSMSRMAVFWKTSLFVIHFISVIAFTWVILPRQFEGISKPLLGSYVAFYVVQNSYTAMWIFNFHFIKLLAVDLLNIIKELLQANMTPGKQLSEYRHLWLSVWDLSQKYSFSIAISISFVLLLHSCVFITSCYGILSLIRLPDPVVNTLPLLPYLIASFGHVFAIIEAGHRAKTALKDDFLKTFVKVDRDTIDHEGYDEVKLFTRTILETDPKITLYDYITVDRTLLVSFMSSSITYLIVLLQFRASEEKSESQESSTSYPFENENATNILF
ncbi:Gustatory Receptor [Nesidiocoris tenuis]|uniref:Gustatory receptor n=1 Tax=Nesidiocoris tenuis TaxID=355587 RepID=A0ABN7B1N9_9HEMI|nr:Gustatory Receptor [Nesidiocoris tenuis]